MGESVQARAHRGGCGGCPCGLQQEQQQQPVRTRQQKCSRRLGRCRRRRCADGAGEACGVHACSGVLALQAQAAALLGLIQGAMMDWSADG